MTKVDEHKIWFDKGVSLLEEKKYAQALDCFQKAIDIQPHFIPSWVYKGISLEQLQRYDEAIDCYTLAIQINPNVADLWYNKGATYCIMKRYHDALTCFDKVLEIEPLHALAKTTRSLVIVMPSIIPLTPKKPDKNNNQEDSSSEEVEIPIPIQRHRQLQDEVGKFFETEFE
ncbi:tetratricopeptide repeat protein [Iningainema tapete]|uniref:Tetratricopeptide repeat protein n=1 Tax=Iningainema tapete BLCC-T55 TaxID=2748662 RepID=A0A8J7C6S4_9CYAN|nr:tetratricopeptide repeat protein [Iningainema tapete BLCC-T55]